jgi:RNA recognition motif-containing protein
MLSVFFGLDSARIIIDRDTGKSKGYGFITYTSSEEAAAAVTAMDGKVIFQIIWLCVCLLSAIYTVH